MKNSATTSTETDLNTDSIETLRIQVNNQILTLHDSHYSLNTMTNLIFFEILKQQEFEIEKIRRSDDLYLCNRSRSSGWLAVSSVEVQSLLIDWKLFCVLIL